MATQNLSLIHIFMASVVKLKKPSLPASKLSSSSAECSRVGSCLSRRQSSVTSVSYTHLAPYDAVPSTPTTMQPPGSPIASASLS